MERTSEITTTLSRKIPLPQVSDVTRYQLTYTLLLSLVPLACGILLVMLLSVFAKLNLFFMEANGLILNLEVREAYYSQVEFEIYGVIGYLLLQIMFTAVASFVVMRWAATPFLNAQKLVKQATSAPERMRPPSRWMSESPVFDRLVWLFCLRVKSGGANQVKEEVNIYNTNFPFLLKFLATFGILSVITGYVFSIIMDTVYGRIVDLALRLMNNSLSTSHFFNAQRDMLQDAANFTVVMAMLLYFLLGLQISRYMATMLYVFSRAIGEDKFPITLRNNDLYQDLAKTLNSARARLPE